MGDHIGMSISADSPSDKTLNRCPLALLLRRQYEFPFGINIVILVQFSFFFFKLVIAPHTQLKYMYAWGFEVINKDDVSEIDMSYGKSRHNEYTQKINKDFFFNNHSFREQLSVRPNFNYVSFVL